MSMSMAALMIRRVSKELALSRSTKLIKTQTLHKLPATPFTPRYQPWKQAFCTTAIGETEASGCRVNVTSREIIKPSFPPPKANKTVQFSLIDQMASSDYIPILFFYQKTDPNDPIVTTEQRSMVLKKSLSETLVDFYPMAGRLRGNELIECTDEGVEFCEAHPTETVTRYTENPESEVLRELLPFQGNTPRHKNIVMSVQVNHLSCGGMAIGVCLSHKIADGAATLNFLNAWASNAQNFENRQKSNNKSCRPEFNGASIFPPLKQLNELPVPEKDDAILTKQKISTRRLIFDRKMIDELKAKAVTTNNNTISRPSGVEVVTAFIWKHFFSHKYTVISHVVNIRSKMVPPIPENCYGNFAWFTNTSPMVGGKDTEYGGFVRELRKGILKINDDYVRGLFYSENFLSRFQKEVVNVVLGSGKCINFSSICKAPLYEVNFGMGKPAWAGFAWVPVNDGVVLLSTKCGEGIEAMIFLLEDDVAQFESQLEHHKLLEAN